MENDQAVRITKQVEDARYVDGAIYKQIRVEFYVGADGPFSERFPKDGYNAQVRDMKLAQFARDITR